MLPSCPKHNNWRPPRGPGGSSAAALCPHCLVEADLRSGRTYLDRGEQIREGSPKSKDPNQRRHTELGLVSDGPPVSTLYKPSPHLDELYSAWLARQPDTRGEEGAALVRIEDNRRRRERQDKPREPRLQSQKWEDGKWHFFYAPERRRDPFILEALEIEGEDF